MLSVPLALAVAYTTYGQSKTQLPAKAAVATAASSTMAMPVASGKNVEKNAKAEIDYSNIADGYVMVKSAQKTDKKLKVMVSGPNKYSYNYSLKSDGTYEVYPLTGGDGSYTVTVAENVSGDKYAVSATAKFEVKLASQYAPYLRPNQFVNYNEKSKAVAKGAELTKGKTDQVEKVSAIYNYIVTNFTYDNQRAATVQKGYIPNVEDVYAKNKGICFDYAAVAATMLRSQGIPTKMVHGYAAREPQPEYHAWLSVYTDKTGWVDGAFQFDGKNWKLMDPTFDSTGKMGEKVRKYINDTKNYSPSLQY